MDLNYKWIECIMNKLIILMSSMTSVDKKYVWHIINSAKQAYNT